MRSVLRLNWRNIAITLIEHLNAFSRAPEPFGREESVRARMEFQVFRTLVMVSASLRGSPGV